MLTEAIIALSTNLMIMALITSIMTHSDLGLCYSHTIKQEFSWLGSLNIHYQRTTKNIMLIGLRMFFPNKPIICERMFSFNFIHPFMIY